MPYQSYVILAFVNARGQILAEDDTNFSSIIVVDELRSETEAIAERDKLNDLAEKGHPDHKGHTYVIIPRDEYKRLATFH